MKKFYLLCVFATLSLFADNPEDSPIVPEEKAVDIAKISEAFGHLIGKNIENLGFEFDIAQVLKGLRDCADGKTAPMTEQECVQAITAVQEKAFKSQAADNLKKAEEFMAANSKQEQVISLEESKLQYKIEKKGEGAEIQAHFSPLIRYTGKYLDGSVFGASKEDEMISLDETIPGLSKALVGMKEGEKRTVYIHPDLGYGTHGYLPPNSLLTFEIECVKANSAKAAEETAAAPTPPQNAEIATPAAETQTAEAVR